MLHPPPPSATNERTKAVVLDLAKQWRLLEEARLAHKTAVAQGAAALEKERTEHRATMQRETAAVAELKVRGSGNACAAGVCEGISWALWLRCWVGGRWVGWAPCVGRVPRPPPLRYFRR
jgi:hypothetical protein